MFEKVSIVPSSDTSLVTNVNMALLRLMYIIYLSGIPSILAKDFSFGSAPQTLIFQVFLTSSVKKVKIHAEKKYCECELPTHWYFLLVFELLGILYIGLHLQRWSNSYSFIWGINFILVWAGSILRVRTTSYRESRMK